MSNSDVDRIAAAEQRKKNPKPGKRTKPGGRKNAEAAGKKDVDQGAPDDVAVDLEDYKGARKKLRHAVKAVVKVKSKEIATTLVGKAEKGDIRGTEMMLSLIDKKKPAKDAKKKKRSGPSWAELLASEPEWDESMEENEETPLTVVGGK